ncbi:hypothetical protein Sango_0513400 [Sesamum angolense]|uniref:Uncharacterized protein n=1 Tax=Sesamum angolense TaxID=2727404 RepID=A0AAE1X4B7_9LAMI|nr:hypothetical protein Sango_0513400 [Sesamum angolense]
MIFSSKSYHSEIPPGKLLSLKPPIKLLFLLGCLEASMPKVGRGVNELELNLFKGDTRSLVEECLTKSNDPFLGTNTATLDHQVIILHYTKVRESTDIFLNPVAFIFKKGLDTKKT